MAETMHFALVSPERELLSDTVQSVEIPGADGDMTALPRHSATITTLRPGVLTVTREGGAVEQFVVTGGFADIAPEGTSVLAESAVRREDASRELLESYKAEFEEAYNAATAEEQSAAQKALHDFEAVFGKLGY